MREPRRCHLPIAEPYTPKLQPEHIMTPCAFLIPGDLALPTGGYAYDRRLLAMLGSHGVDVGHVELPGGFPAPSPQELERTAELARTLPAKAVLLIDGLAYGAMPVELIDTLRGPGRRIVALCHHPLGYEAGLAPERSKELHASETAALAKADAVVVTSGETMDRLVKEFGVPSGRITVAEPGVEPAPRSRGTGKPVRLLAVGTLVPRKGYGDLVDGLSRIKDLDWEMTIAGADDRHPQEAQRIRRLVAAAGLTDRVEIPGAVGDDRLHRLFDAADLFVMTSLYEGYGMALAEAMARGLPIVTTRCGAAAALVPDEAASKIAPGDSVALGAALRAMIGDDRLRGQKARASWLAGQQLPRWEDTARIVAEVIRRLKA
jgi:glycosyltransferase involved in cell wall biosynthesis